MKDIPEKNDNLENDMQKVEEKEKDYIYNIDINQRPTSKFKDRLSSAKSKTEQKEIKFSKEEFYDKFNEHLKRNKITIKDFEENMNIYVDRQDIRERFRAIHFEITSNEVEHLFNMANPNQNEEYISIKTFLDFHNSVLVDSQLKSQNNENSSSNHSKVSNDSIKDMFNSFRNEIIKIAEKTNADIKKKKILPPVSKIRANTAKNTTKNETTEKKEKKEKMPKNAFLLKTLKKEQSEENKMKIAIEQMNKDYLIDCIKKMNLANTYASELKKGKTYSAHQENDSIDSENSIICIVTDTHNKNKTTEINLKTFLVEFKKLEKEIQRKKEREKYQYVDIDKLKKNSLNNSEFLQKDRNTRQQTIRAILKESLFTKIELKNQLKALRDKKVIDPSIINSMLKLTNLDDNTII